MNYRIHVPDRTEDKILIEVDIPECSPQDLEELRQLSRELNIRSFLEWVEWMPIRDEDKEWAYWEAKAPNPSLAEFVKAMEERNARLEEEDRRLRGENERLQGLLIESKKSKRPYKKLENREAQDRCWKLQSKIIVLEEENRILRNKLAAFASKPSRKKRMSP